MEQPKTQNTFSFLLFCVRVIFFVKGIFLGVRVWEAPIGLSSKVKTKHCLHVCVRVRFDYHLLRGTRKTADGSLVVVG